MWWKSQQQGFLGLTIALLLPVCILNLVTIVQRVTEYRKYQRVQSFTYVGNDFPERLPLDRHMGLIDSTFQNTSDWYPVSGPDAEPHWMSVYPGGFGFVRLGSERRILCVSMFHQLHCVDKMRRALDNPDDPVATIPHLQHCMNYLRQMLLCASDVTLEPEEYDPVRNVTGATGATGVGVTHTCRDWSAVYDTNDGNFEKWQEYWEVVKDTVPSS